MKRKSYPERIRAALFFAIKRTAANLDTCAKVPGKDFSRTRKLPLQAMLLMLIGMGSGSLSKELYDWFGYTSSTATVSAFVQGDIDGHLLEAFQLHPEAVSTHLSFFLSYCAAHGNALVDFIAAECLGERQYFAQVLHERRLADTGAALIVAAKILLRYAVSIGATMIPDAGATLDMWCSALIQALRVSEAFSREADPLAVYLREFFDLIDAGKIALAPSAAAYTPSAYLGFEQEGHCWLLHAPLHELICQHLRAKGLQFHLQEGAIRKLLHANGLIEVSQEGSSDKGKIVFTKKASIEGRPHMLVLRTDAARSYVEHHINF